MSDTAAGPAPMRLVLAAAPSADPGLDPGAGPAGAPPQIVVLRADAEHVVIEAASRLTLRVGASALTLDADGTILLHGVCVTVAADEALTSYSAGAHAIRGAAVDVN